MHPDNFKFNDGGRAAAGYKGDAGDCVPRAIAIATGKAYQEVYNDLHQLGKGFKKNSRSAEAQLTKMAKRGSLYDPSPRTGVLKKVYHPYILSLGWTWVPTMFIGKGCQVHLDPAELPGGNIIVRLSRHITTMIDGIINDTYDPRREVHWATPYRGQELKPGQEINPGNNMVVWVARRCVYGYYIKASPLV